MASLLNQKNTNIIVLTIFLFVIYFTLTKIINKNSLNLYKSFLQRTEEGRPRHPAGHPGSEQDRGYLSASAGASQAAGDPRTLRPAAIWTGRARLPEAWAQQHWTPDWLTCHLRPPAHDPPNELVTSRRKDSANNRRI